MLLLKCRWLQLLHGGRCRRWAGACCLGAARGLRGAAWSEGMGWLGRRRVWCVTRRRGCPPAGSRDLLLRLLQSLKRKALQVRAVEADARALQLQRLARGDTAAAGQMIAKLQQ